MSDRMSKEQRSYTMSRIRSVGNASTEVRVIHLIRTHGLHGWRRRFPIPGKPDLAYPAKRLAIFLDGCFWHGCERCSLRPKSNVEYWNAKIAGNIERDLQVNRELKANGWRVIRIWEHVLKERPNVALARIRATYCGLRKTT